MCVCNWIKEALYKKSTWLPNSTFFVFYLLYIPRSLSHTSSGSTSSSLYIQSSSTRTRNHIYILKLWDPYRHQWIYHRDLGFFQRMKSSSSTSFTGKLPSCLVTLTSSPTLIFTLTILGTFPVYTYTYLSLYICIMQHDHNDPVVHQTCMYI